MKIGEGGKLGPGKKEPGEGQSAPEFARGGKALISDVVALPEKPADLSDPFKNSVLVAFGTYLLELKRSGRSLDNSERAALLAMRDKLFLLKRDCEKEGLAEKSAMLKRGIARIGKVLGEDTVATTRGSVGGGVKKWFAKLIGKGGEK